METDSSGNDIGLVVRLRLAADGLWYLSIDGTTGAQTIPLTPVTLIIRLRRSGASGVLRGSLRLHGGDVVAPIQLGSQIEALLYTWLSQGGAPPGNQ